MDPNIEKYNAELKGASAQEIIQYFAVNFKGKIAFASSLGLEDQVLTEMIAGIDPEIRIFTLDTGRLFQETYDLLDITGKKYGIKIEVMFPDAEDVEEMVNSKGINLFYDSIENRKLCCYIRKTEPLSRALSGVSTWITGLRREQSVTRTQVSTVEWDDIQKKIKVNPLADWTTEQVLDYICSHKIPYNTLHDKGYPSIGCLPCTRPVEPGTDIRSGRWWWESPDNKECGLHQK
ncbi:MAG: phosphoadenylyl-sulfate reductase [Bacteroidetes bacterium]|nr:phosphoadenylyl-sulfate reductase [Bacteroidota bacterium]